MSLRSYTIPFVGALFLLTACGYRPLLGSSRNVEKVYLPVVDNTTSYDSVAEPLTTRLRSGFKEMGVRTVGPDGGGWTVKVVVVAIQHEVDGIRREGTREMPADMAWQVNALVTVLDPEGARAVDSQMVTARAGSAVPGSLVRELSMGEGTRDMLLEQLGEKIVLMVVEL